MPTLAELNSQHALPGIAEIIAARGNFPAVRITSSAAEGLVYLHGAHVAAWKPHGAAEVLWLSEKSFFENGKPIRGGVPICFPWFGPRENAPASPPAPPSPMHGFARLRTWNLQSIRQDPAGVTVTLALASDAATRATWQHDFLLRHIITFGPQLTMTLELTNTGTAPLTAEEALHTYFALADARQIHATGLEGTRYIDKTDAFKEKTQDNPITLTGETNRIYLDTTATVTIDDPGKSRRIVISKEGSRNTVVWNPWSATAKTMADFSEDAWPGMMCVETCNVGPNAVTLAPGLIHRMTARLQPA